jgi:hypothetical protein
MDENLQEFFDSRGVPMRIDREAGILRGVKILGLQSRNNRSYLPEALVQAAPLYEGAKVNVNHPKGRPLGPRDYQDRMGVIRSVQQRPGEGLFADFHFNPRHVLAEQLLWDAEHAPENVGFSHNVEARTVRRGNQVVVEAITRVVSVDLVADPATTRGLFESGVPAAAECAALTVESLREQRPDLVEAIAGAEREEIVRLRDEVARLRAVESVERRRAAVGRLLREFELPDLEPRHPEEKLIVSDTFVESLLEAPDEATMRKLVEERSRLVHALRRNGPLASGAKPTSLDQSLVYGGEPLDTKRFVEAITGSKPGALDVKRFVAAIT